MTERVALYFGMYDGAGHYMHSVDRGRFFRVAELYPDFPWEANFCDGGLLANGKRPDVYDGKVFGTVGGRPNLWHAFVWWDRSGDKRRNSSSGFYVRGWAGWSEEDRQAAFAFACDQWPEVVARQHHGLLLQPLHAAGSC